MLKGIDLILLHMANRIERQRSLAGCFHILTGKKSGQAIQDATLFGYQNWFGLFPDWNRSHFESLVQELMMNGKLVPVDNMCILSREAKLELQYQLEPLHFEQRAFATGAQTVSPQRVKICWNRLQLLSQVISFYLSKEQNYVPQISDVTVQKWVKGFWHSLSDKETFIFQFHKAMSRFLTELDPLLAHLLLGRLSGHHVNAQTIYQLSRQYQIPEAITHLYLYQAIGLLYISLQSDDFSTLVPIIMEEEHENKGLTQSTAATYSLLLKGFSIQEISNYRKLKISTIEDHIIEIAIHQPNLDLSQFVRPEVIEEVCHISDQLGTQKIKQIKEHIDPSVSYFQIRLALVRRKQYERSSHH
ncbi:helix-turn-helix domain-containing protein [Caldalkalibacillus mannanilyticus]|uniref:helix-turn-helix domain-containing protein n=1 Tax=Caldalkalibacillus mannanilyticus TaxID=1418 RepID=UPI00046824A4|nr:helix-turn-helix domain-containing protein [Caldalkalibacillus mannanilyticus]